MIFHKGTSHQPRPAMGLLIGGTVDAHAAHTQYRAMRASRDHRHKVVSRVRWKYFGHGRYLKRHLSRSGMGYAPERSTVVGTFELRRPIYGSMSDYHYQIYLPILRK